MSSRTVAYRNVRSLAVKLLVFFAFIATCVMANIYLCP